MASHHPIRKQVVPEPTVIPDKLYFRIGDVARLCDVPAYVLRFWETEFPQLKPNKGGTGQRLYRKRDVEMALRIKSLLYDQGYTIPGARQAFKSDAKIKDASEPPEAVATPARSQPEPPIAAEPLPYTDSDVDIGAAIRQDAHYRHHLSSLRDELRSLAALLANGSAPEQPAFSAQAEEPSNLKPMRPRLVLEPKPKPEPKPEPRLVNQGDLFSSE